MKKLTEAPQPDFASYVNRPETEYVEREASDPLDDLYANGYLPYSSTKGLRHIFYSARSARVILPQFTLSSENRRIAKKFDGQFTKKRITVSEFVADEAFYTFVLEYFKNRHGEKVMPKERLDLLLESGLITTVVEYKSGAALVGYALEVEQDSMRHYWYSAYDVSLTQQSLGMWLMLDCIRDAKEAGFTHYYLGTVYGQKALYKTNFTPLEWWDGTSWSSNVDELKQKGRAD